MFFVFIKMIVNRAGRIVKSFFLFWKRLFGGVMAMLPTRHSSIKHRGMTVRFRNNDIRKVMASAVVTGEGPDLARESGVTKSLLQCLPQLREERSLHKQRLWGKKDLPFGTVLISDLTRPRLRGPKNFRYVLHAVLDTVRSSKKQWLRDMEVLYENIFRTAEDNCISSLAVPLLGSGRADADKDLAIKALATAVVSCKTRYPTELLVVCNDKRLLDSIQKNFYSSPGRTGRDMNILRLVATLAGDFLKYILGYGGEVKDKSRNNGISSKESLEQHEREEQRQINQAKQNSMIDEKRRSPGPSYKKHGGHWPNERQKSKSPYSGQGQSTDYLSQSTQSDEAIARSLQHDEEMRVGKHRSERYFKSSRRDDASESEDHGDIDDGHYSDEEKNSTTDKDLQDNNEDDQEETCSICLNTVSDPKTLDKCGHVFCRGCIDRSFQDYKPVCPTCNMVYGEVIGNQPDGQMDVGFSGDHLPGYEGQGTITITYYFPSGTQGDSHPNPGRPFKGTTRIAYLPDSKEGRAVLKLLRLAFDRKLTFTIGRSTTTGREDVVTWNDIHHKTNRYGGPTRFGYPDATYLTRVREELASKGITG